MVPRLWGSWGGWFYADDFWAQDLATRYSVWDSITLTAGGHFSPLTSLLSSLFTRMTLFDWPAHVALAGILWVLADVVIVLAFRELWGWGWPSATAYAIYAVSTLTVPSFLWAGQVWLGWASVFALALMLLTVIRAIKRPGFGRIVLAWLALVVGLMLTERAAIEAVCIGLFGLAAFARPLGGFRRFLKQNWVLYVGSAVLLGLYSALYVLATKSTGSDPLLSLHLSASGLAANVLEGFGQSVAPALIGGPWFLDGGAVIARSEMPSIAVLAAIETLAILVGLAWLARRRGAAAVGVLLLVIVVTLVMIGAARGSLGGLLAMRDWRYYGNLAVWFPLILMTVLVDPLPDGRRVPPAELPERLTASLRRHPVVWALLALVVMNGTLMTTYLTADRFRGTTARPFLEQTLADLERLGPIVLADQTLPDSVVPAILTTQRRASRVLSAATPRPTFDQPTQRLYVISDTGAIVVADVAGGSATRPGPDGSCGTAVQPGDTERLRLAAPLYDWTWWARMDYLAQSDTHLKLKMAGKIVDVPVAKGPGSVFFPASGSVDSIYVTAPRDGGGVCVAGVSVGLAVPRTASG
jgi:hypothetical protein